MQQIPGYGGGVAPAYPQPQVAPVDPYDLLEGGKRSIKFVEKDANGFDQHAPVGTSFTGLIVGDLRSAPITDFVTKAPKLYDDGRPQMQVVIDLQTDLRDPDDPTDNGIRALYVKNQMLAAFQQALQATRHLGKIGEGTRVTVTLVGYKPTNKGNPQKLYDVQIGPEFVAWVPPEQRQVQADVYGAQGVPTQPQYVTPQAPAFPGQVVPQGLPQQVQAAQQAGFPPQATVPSYPQVAVQPQAQVPVQPIQPAQQPIVQGNPAAQFPTAVQPQGVAAVPQPSSPALAALNAIAAAPAPQAVAPEAAQAAGVEQGDVEAFNTLRNNGIDPHTAITSLAQRRAPGNEAAFSAQLAAAVGVELAPTA